MSMLAAGRECVKSRHCGKGVLVGQPPVKITLLPIKLLYLKIPIKL